MREALMMQIVDRASGSNLNGWWAALDDIRPGGLGLHFIREIMDSVTFRHIGGRNYLRLIKSLTPQNPAGQNRRFNVQATTRRLAKIAIIDISGDIDLASSPQLRAVLLKELKDFKPSRMALNLNAVRYIDSSASRRLSRD